MKFRTHAVAFAVVAAAAAAPACAQTAPPAATPGQTIGTPPLGPLAPGAAAPVDAQARTQADVNALDQAKVHSDASTALDATTRAHDARVPTTRARPRARADASATAGTTGAPPPRR